MHVGPTHHAAPQSMVNDVGLAAAQDGCVLLLQSAIGGERSLIGRPPPTNSTPQTGIGLLVGRTMRATKAATSPHGTGFSDRISVVPAFAPTQCSGAWPVTMRT